MEYYFVTGFVLLSAICICILFTEHPELDPATILPDGRFNHVVQIQERLRFMR